MTKDAFNGQAKSPFLMYAVPIDTKNQPIITPEAALGLPSYGFPARLLPTVTGSDKALIIIPRTQAGHDEVLRNFSNCPIIDTSVVRMPSPEENFPYTSTDMQSFRQCSHYFQEPECLFATNWSFSTGLNSHGRDIAPGLAKEAREEALRGIIRPVTKGR